MKKKQFCTIMFLCFKHLAKSKQTQLVSPVKSQILRGDPFLRSSRSKGEFRPYRETDILQTRSPGPAAGFQQSIEDSEEPQDPKGNLCTDNVCVIPSRMGNMQNVLT